MHCALLVNQFNVNKCNHIVKCCQIWVPLPIH